MPECYTIFARKNSFCPNLGVSLPLPPSPTPMVMVAIIVNPYSHTEMQTKKPLKAHRRIDQYT